jgi:hypothetical protein
MRSDIGVALAWSGETAVRSPSTDKLAIPPNARDCEGPERTPGANLTSVRSVMCFTRLRNGVPSILSVPLFSWFYSVLRKRPG